MSKLNNQVMNMIVRGVVTSTDDAKGIQVIALDMLDGERKDNVERVQNYGFTSVPIGEAEATVICAGGDRSAATIIALDNRGQRMTGLSPGEVAIYTDEGDSIVLNRNNEIEITTRRLKIVATELVRVETPRMECTGDIIDNCDTQANTVRQMRDIYNDHTHGENGTGGGTTNPPGQKQ
jgi:phage baseplate assembly protein V